ncbi:hypothetical protein LBMAG54_14770 [Nitrosopumilaceae archaeon]|nr:hypothetical protein LBMAG54_14770 [Nitrosopumilaceae archaeon]
MTRKEKVRLALELLLELFEEPYFPRTISTKKKGNAQVVINSIDEAIQYFEDAKWFDCRISLFGQNEIEQIIPNAIFIDLDDKDALEIVKIRIRELIGGIPLVISTGLGYAIIQPIQIKSMKGIEMGNLSDYEISQKFLKFAKDYLTNDRADSKNHPSLKSCLIRVPYTINSKNDSIVEFKESWNGQRVSVKNIPFRKYIEHITKQSYPSKYTGTINPQKFQWIEQLLKIKINDHRNFLLFDVCRYLVNIKKFSVEESMDIIHIWLDSLEYSKSKILYEAKKAIKDGKLPRKLETIQTTNPEVFEHLTLLGIND